MVIVTAETSVSSTADVAWAALGRRATYASFPGLSPIARGATFRHDLDLPIVDRHEQTATLSIGKIPSIVNSIFSGAAGQATSHLVIGRR